MDKLALVLFSGGLDSCLSLLYARKECGGVEAVTFDYGQKAGVAEIRAAKKICRHNKIPHDVVDIPLFKAMRNHPFFSPEIKPPSLTAADLGNNEKTRSTAKAVWVPNRNGLMLNIAAALAEMRGINKLYVGFNAEEGATFPDNTEAFVKAINDSFHHATQNHVVVCAPTIDMTKRDIVSQLVKNDFPLTDVWSCYEGGEKMCGLCESCQRLQRALKENRLNQLSDAMFL